MASTAWHVNAFASGASFTYRTKDIPFRCKWITVDPLIIPFTVLPIALLTLAAGLTLPAVRRYGASLAALRIDNPWRRSAESIVDSPPSVDQIASSLNQARATYLESRKGIASLNSYDRALISVQSSDHVVMSVGPFAHIHVRVSRLPNGQARLSSRSSLPTGWFLLLTISGIAGFPWATPLSLIGFVVGARYDFTAIPSLTIFQLTSELSQVT